MIGVSRRAILRGAAAASALAAAPASLATTTTAPAVDPLVALYGRFDDLNRQYRAHNARCSAIHETLPECARGGWPKIDRTLAIFRDFPPIGDGFPGLDDRLNRDELAALNLDLEERTGGDRGALARVRSDSRARVRWWKAWRRDGKRISAESGWDAAAAVAEESCDAMRDALDAVFEAEPTTVAGAVLKLRAVVHAMEREHCDHEDVVDREEFDPHETAAVAVLADFERLAGGAS